MKSPFPGMDPYLERHWEDVHQRLCTYSCDALNEQLGGDLRARLGERLVVESDLDPIRAMYPDVRIFEKGRPGKPVAPMAAGVALAEPLVVEFETEAMRQPFVQIVDVRSGGTVVTVIEFLSPSNKLAGDAQRQYSDKQREVIAAGINMVEIDLTRRGQRRLLYPTANLPPDYQTLYLACVRRGLGANRFEIYRMPLRERLPAIRIPLRQADPDIVLDIQAMVDQAYAKGRYEDLDYRQPCVPPLDGEDAAWAEQLLRG